MLPIYFKPIKIFFLLAVYSLLLPRGTSAFESTGNELLLSISIFSDPHLYDTTLGTTGLAFYQYLNRDRKMLRESEAILQAVVERISNDNSQIVLIPGDLTKDGELQNHLLMAKYLRKLEISGKKVYVVPGNHDINNPGSFSYADGKISRVPTVTAEEFKKIYAEFGFNEAISTDPNGSLSYIAEPTNGVWLFCLDACRWRENEGSDEAITGGRFNEKTMEWIRAKLAEGRSKNKILIGMMHHNLVEHFVGQSLVFPDYIVEDWEEVCNTFAEFGLNLVFTGHNHSHDARLITVEKGLIVDVMTSSIVTWPCAIRRVNIHKSGIVEVFSEKMTKINFNCDGLDFQTYAKEQLTKNLSSMIESLLKQVGLSKTNTTKVSNFIVNTYLGYLHGNENQFINDDTQKALESLKEVIESIPSISHLFPILEGMIKDLPPDDYDFLIDLKTGVITKAEFK